MRILIRLIKFLATTFFTLFLFLAILSFSLSQLTSPQKIPELIEIISTTYEKNLQNELDQLEKGFAYIQAYCKQNNEINFSVGNKNITIYCSEIENKTSKEFAKLVLNRVIKEKVKEFYYKNYTCKFTECWKDNLTYYYSFQAHQSYFTLTNYFIVASILSALLIFVIEKFSALKTLGITFIFLGISYFFKFVLKELIRNFIPVKLIGLRGSLINIISPLFDNFLYLLILGIILLAIYFLTKRLKSKVTIHDNCFSKSLGSESWDTNRQILNELGLKIIEMEHNKENATCCGFGAASYSFNVLDIMKQSYIRLKEAESTGAKALIVYCSACLFIFSVAKELLNIKLPIFHIFELVQFATGETPKHNQSKRSWDIISIFTVQMLLNLFSKNFKIKTIDSNKTWSFSSILKFKILKLLNKLFHFRMVRIFYSKLFKILLKLYNNTDIPLVLLF